MSLLKKYIGRTFTDIKNFQSHERIIAKLSSTNTWLNTVEIGLELDRATNKYDNTILKITRWRARNEDDDKKVWRVWRSYNVRSIEEWGNISNIINNLVKTDIKTGKSIPISVENLNKFYEILDERHAFKKRISRMRLNIKELDNTLRDYNKLISEENATETDVHKFLIKNKAYWMFGLEYVEIKNKVRITQGKQYFESDLMLQRHDDFWDLVELKGPGENLFNKLTKTRSTPNKALSSAISQVFAYLYAIDTMYDVNIVKPKAYIVIGRYETDRPLERRIFSSYLNNVEIITYSDLFKRGQRLLKHIKSTYSAK